MQNKIKQKREKDKEQKKKNVYHCAYKSLIFSLIPLILFLILLMIDVIQIAFFYNSQYTAFLKLLEKFEKTKKKNG